MTLTHARQIDMKMTKLTLVGFWTNKEYKNKKTSNMFGIMSFLHQISVSELLEIDVRHHVIVNILNQLLIYGDIVHQS